jgi:hypothetical protein
MAANDYYDNHPSQSYHSQPPPRMTHTSESPFDGPFEDSAYPLGEMGSHGMDSQTTLRPDARYYGQGGGGRPQDSQTSFQDDIPLRDHPGGLAKGDEPTDHVYDAPTPMAGEQRSKRRSGNAFFKTPLAKVPWVVYTLSLIQIAVFIAEIAKNGGWANTD